MLRSSSYDTSELLLDSFDAESIYTSFILSVKYRIVVWHHSIEHLTGISGRCLSRASLFYRLLLAPCSRNLLEMNGKNPINAIKTPSGNPMRKQNHEGNEDSILNPKFIKTRKCVQVWTQSEYENLRSEGCLKAQNMLKDIFICTASGLWSKTTLKLSMESPPLS